MNLFVARILCDKGAIACVWSDIKVGLCLNELKGLDPRARGSNPLFFLGLVYNAIYVIYPSKDLPYLTMLVCDIQALKQLASVHEPFKSCPT